MFSFSSWHNIQINSESATQHTVVSTRNTAFLEILSDSKVDMILDINFEKSSIDCSLKHAIRISKIVMIKVDYKIGEV